MLSLALRHNPASIGITLDNNGWTDVATLIKQMNRHNFKLTKETLAEVVKNNDKHRFAFNEDKTKIRASQGHSIKVNLGYIPQVPPAVLCHGTASHFIESILATGLDKKSRHHVHLCADIQTAEKVGQRKGKPVVLIIDAKAMSKNGFEFFLSENNVWLTDNVPPQYLHVYKS